MKIRQMKQKCAHYSGALARARAAQQDRFAAHGQWVPAVVSGALDRLYRQTRSGDIPDDVWGWMDCYSQDGVYVLLRHYKSLELTPSRMWRLYVAMASTSRAALLRAFLAECLMRPGLRRDTARAGWRLLMAPGTSAAAIGHWAHRNYPRGELL